MGLSSPFNIQSPQHLDLPFPQSPSQAHSFKISSTSYSRLPLFVSSRPTISHKKIRNLQRNFLWHGHNPDKKWALVSWDKFCKPKSLGGLGLWDPGKLNNTMGAKIWWRWLKTPTELWEKLWKHKYALHTPQAQLIRLHDKTQGSNIWNAAWKNRSLIQEHAFWEIRNGQSALFWMDSWQQLPPLQTEDNLRSYENHIQDLTSLKVAELWSNTSNNPPWRSWKTTPQDLHTTTDCDLQHWKQMTNQRRIHISTDQTFLDGVIPHMETSHSKKATFCRKNSKTFKKITYGQ
jgi:hypothetical protein